MRELKISRHLNQIKKEVTMLETLGVEVVTLAFNRFSMDPNVKVQHIASRKTEPFLNDASIRAFGIFLADTSSAATAASSREDEKKDLMKKVQELFNKKYNEAGGTGKLPYKKAIVQATGLPQGMTLRKPNFYGKDQLKAILENAHQISLQIRKELDPEGLSPSPGRPQTSLPVIPVLHTSGQLAGALSSQSLTQGPESQSPQSLTQVKKKKKGGSRKRKAVVELSQVEDDAIVNDPTKIFMAMMVQRTGVNSTLTPRRLLEITCATSVDVIGRMLTRTCTRSGVPGPNALSATGGVTLHVALRIKSVFIAGKGDQIQTVNLRDKRAKKKRRKKEKIANLQAQKDVF
ncbi:uncharacterized protein LOC133456243 [Cololabis saira]|uniref:uncharacterized protein LOC133456243 n=1 Tax=Cololabis saira TaxID=129043 RepID=UPI002AD274D2|nr:uncharacterized protein LOC133456243 [Cololabis saira]